MLQSCMGGIKSKLVYSTEQTIPKKDRPGGKQMPNAIPDGQQKVYVRLDRKGRGGKSVTVIEGLHMSGKDLDSLCRQLKARFGTGGTVKDGAIEIQGDHCDAIMQQLTGSGYRPKRSGG